LLRFIFKAGTHSSKERVYPSARRYFFFFFSFFFFLCFFFFFFFFCFFSDIYFFFFGPLPPRRSSLKLFGFFCPSTRMAEDVPPPTDGEEKAASSATPRWFFLIAMLGCPPCGIEWKCAAFRPIFLTLSFLSSLTRKPSLTCRQSFAFFTLPFCFRFLASRGFLILSSASCCEAGRVVPPLHFPLACSHFPSVLQEFNRVDKLVC